MYLLRALCVCGSIVFLSSSAFAQVGKETTHWNWTEPSEIHKGMVAVKVKGGGGLSWSGSGMVVSGNRVLTAAHVLDNGLTFEVVFFDGSTKVAKVVNLNTQVDVGVLSIDATPDGVTILKVAEQAPMEGDYVEICGFGGSGPLRHFSGHVGIFSDDVLGVDAYVLPGDSGGAALNEKGEVIGVVSGGMCWSPRKTARTESGAVLKATWPVRCGSLGAIKKALQ